MTAAAPAPHPRMMQPARVCGVALTQRRVYGVHREAQRRHLPGAAVYPSGCLLGARTAGSGWKRGAATCARDRGHRSLRSTPQAVTAGVIAHGDVRHKYASAKAAIAPPLTPRLQGSRHATLCVITARPTTLEPSFGPKPTNIVVMASATVRHHGAPVPPLTAGSRGLPVAPWQLVRTREMPCRC